MSAYNKRPSLKTHNISETIRKHAYTKGVVMVLDIDGDNSLSSTGTPYVYDQKNKTLTVILPNLNDNTEVKKVCLELLKEVFECGEIPLMTSMDKTIKLYKKYSSKNNDKETLDFYGKILNTDDLGALKMSLFIKAQKNAQQDISSYRRSIKDRFGYRGLNISNLCSAGYFDTEFRNLYNSAPSQFQEYYEIVVGKGARALFVNLSMSVSDVEKAFDYTLNKAMKYHLSEFRIHGKGLGNINTIKSLVSELNKDTKQTDYTIDEGYFNSSFPAIEYIVTINK